MGRELNQVDILLKNIYYIYAQINKKIINNDFQGCDYYKN